MSSPRLASAPPRLSARQLLELRRTLDAPGVEWAAKILRVTRHGDHGRCRVTITATRDGVQLYRAVGLSVRLETTARGITPHLRGYTERSRTVLRDLQRATSPGAWVQLCYAVDSWAHYWCADNAPELYDR